MAIISANRFSKMNGNFIIAANESYGVEDMGRILVENERNDQAIFTAALLSDMHEIKCRTEGTLLESELEALSESSIKQFFEKIIEKLKKFWAKIKGFFKRAYAMITAYVVRNGKMFIKANRKEIDKLTGNSEIKGDMLVPKSGDLSKDKVDIDYTPFHIEGAVLKSTIHNLGATSSTEIAKEMLKRASNKDYNGEDNFFKWLKEANFEKSSGTVTLDKFGGTGVLLPMLENGMTAIKKTKESEKKVEKALQDSIKKLQQKEKEFANKATDADIKKKHEDLATFYNAAATGMTNAMSTAISADIKMQKNRLSIARIALARAIAKNNVVENALLESQVQEILEDAAEMEDNTPAPGEDPELDAATEKVVDAVEELIDQAAEEAADEGCDEE